MLARIDFRCLRCSVWF